MAAAASGCAHGLHDVMLEGAVPATLLRRSRGGGSHTRHSPRRRACTPQAYDYRVDRTNDGVTA